MAQEKKNKKIFTFQIDRAVPPAPSIFLEIYFRKKQGAHHTSMLLVSPTPSLWTGL